MIIYVVVMNDDSDGTELAAIYRQLRPAQEHCERLVHGDRRKPRVYKWTCAAWDRDGPTTSGPMSFWSITNHERGYWAPVVEVWKVQDWAPVVEVWKVQDWAPVVEVWKVQD
jgi:hypothetical protein